MKPDLKSIIKNTFSLRIYLFIIIIINSIWNTEHLPEQWKESIIVPIHKKGNKTDCSNYRGISLPSTSCKML
jgi:hypothetical protein